MSHYERRLQADLDAIRSAVGEIGADVGRAVGDAARALLRHDLDLAAQTILGDHPINRASRHLDRMCHEFVARHLPSAGVLRLVSSVMRLSIELERVGDYAVTIAREAMQLTAPPPEPVARDVEMMAEQAQHLLAQSMQAFIDGNAELARGTKGITSQTQRSFDNVFADLLDTGQSGERPLKDLFALLIALNRLERIAAQAKNICEETIFAATGETKQPKVYRVLFVDARNDLLGPMAEAIARKAYPEGGRFASAGWDPAAEVDPGLIEFMDRHGHDLRSARPDPLPTTLDELNDYHVIVGLQGPVADHLNEIPFHTVVVDWDVPGAGATEPRGDDDLTRLHEELASRVCDLMDVLRGDTAS